MKSRADRSCPSWTRREFIQGSLATAALSVAPAAGAITQTTRRPHRPVIKVPLRTIALPQSGGSLAGLGETFRPDPFTGTEGVSVPLPLSENRDGFGPKLSLAYSVTNGNGPFGIGWRLDFAEVTRKTQTRLPSYGGDDEFLLGGDDLIRKSLASEGAVGEYRVRSYCLRHEQEFSRIERWSRRDGSPSQPGASACFWVVTTKDNVTTLYGSTTGAVVADPERAERVARWAPEIAYDGKGNFIHYRYKAENGEAVPGPEGGRQVAQIYLKRLRYGNLRPVVFADPLAALDYLTSGWGPEDCFFEAVFDYGEHQRLLEGDQVVDEQTYSESRAWDVRADPFSSFRPGFDVRTRRLCRRVLMFHRLEGTGPPELVGSLDFAYGASHNRTTRLESVIRRGYRRAPGASWRYSEDYRPRGSGVRTRSHEVCSLPPLQLRYSDFVAPRREDLLTLSLEGPGHGPAPNALGDEDYALVDLFQRGLPDILHTSGTGYWYWRNLGGGRFKARRRLRHAPSGVTLKDPRVGFAEMSGDGAPDLVVTRGDRMGYCRSLLGTDEDSAGWQEQPTYFPGAVPFTLADPNLQFVDLTGTGSLDALLTEPGRFVAYESRGAQGFVRLGEVPRQRDLDRFPDVSFSDERVFLADMTGDGLADIVQVQTDQGEIHYWPNLGFGRFGRRVRMANSPRVAFGSNKFFLADLDGNGTADLVYLASGRVEFWLNESGNGWGPRQELVGLPASPSDNPPQLVDLFGEGVTGLLWSGSGDIRRYKYLRLSREKPFLLAQVDNGRGQRVRYQYLPSTSLALSPDGGPRLARLPFPVHVLAKVERFDDVANTMLVSSFDYAHGHYDEEQKEFKGFGRVERRDTELYSAAAPFASGGTVVGAELHQPPALVKQWFHTGFIASTGAISRHYAHEYFAGDRGAVPLPDSSLPPDLPDAAAREAARSLAGRILREEVYALDGSPLAGLPYTVSEHSYRVRRTSSVSDDSARGFWAHPEQVLRADYERAAADPRLTHEINLAVDDLGHVTESVTAAYPRRPGVGNQPEQDRLLATYTKRRYAVGFGDRSGLRHGVLAEEARFEVSGLPRPGALLEVPGLAPRIDGARTLAFEEAPAEALVSKRPVSCTRSIYLSDDGRVLPLGQTGLLALRHNVYELALTPGLLSAAYGARIDAGALAAAGYLSMDGAWWVPSGHPEKGELLYDRQLFHLPVEKVDPLGHSVTATYDRFALFVTETRNELGSRVRAEYDYRALQASAVEDVNGNRREVAFDALGRVVGTAVMGKVGEAKGDSLAGFRVDLSQDELARLAEDPVTLARGLLAGATSRVIYDAWRHRRTSTAERAGGPVTVQTIERETHASEAGAGTESRLLHRTVYLDGSGREVQTKTRVAPGAAPARDAGGLLKRGADGSLVLEDQGVRWVGSGRTVFDNKGNPIRKYEPFFSSTAGYETERELVDWGVSSTLRYDPLGRLVRTDQPDGTFVKVEFSAWQKTTYDENDTVLDSDWYAGRGAPDPAGPAPAEPRQRAAYLAARHAGTPTIVHFDPLGRRFLSVSSVGAEGALQTRLELDIQGNERRLTDARGNVAVVTDFDLRGTPLRTRDVDRGERALLYDVFGNPALYWDGGGRQLRYRYDALRRLTGTYLTGADGSEKEVERLVYGEGVPNARSLNLEGEVYQRHDAAGVVTHDEFDFKRNLVRTMRDIAATGQGGTGGRFTTRTRYDALNRPQRIEHAEGSQTEYAYDWAGRLEGVRVQVAGSAGFESHVTRIEYNARGQRTSVAYGNGLRQDLTYDEKTFRLTGHSARRGTEAFLQDLRYDYDPVGNLTQISDEAQKTVFHGNQEIRARWRYEYDALYRLRHAEGREHRGQLADTTPVAHEDIPAVATPHPHDASALENYAEDYDYDEVGNLKAVNHRSASRNWTSSYSYAVASNRLESTNVGGDSLRYEHDANGNMTKMPHVPQMLWDHADRLHRLELGGSASAGYAYDSDGNRIRKEARRDNTVDERLYLPGCEIFRRFKNGRVVLERRSLHLMDGDRRVSTVETLSVKDGTPLPAPSSRTRYQLADHLGSVNLELDERAAVLSYEEYHPFGTSSYRATAGQTGVADKRYRYSGKERDEESGLYYFGARYYAPWLGRWTATDPLRDGSNPYAYVGNNPLRYVDPRGKRREDPERADREEANRKAQTAKEHAPPDRQPAGREDAKDDSKDARRDAAAEHAKKDTEEPIPPAAPGIRHEGNQCVPDEKYVAGPGGTPVLKRGTVAEDLAAWKERDQPAFSAASKEEIQRAQGARAIDPADVRGGPGQLSKNEATREEKTMKAITSNPVSAALTIGKSGDAKHMAADIGTAIWGHMRGRVQEATGKGTNTAGRGGYKNTADRTTGTENAIKTIRSGGAHSESGRSSWKPADREPPKERPVEYYLDNLPKGQDRGR